MADIDAAFEQDVFDLTQRKWVPNVQHHRQADDFGRTVEIAEGIFHRTTLRSDALGIKPIWSDTAFRRVSWFGSASVARGLPDGHLEPGRVLDNLGRKAMTFEGNLDHRLTVAVTPRPGYRLNVSMPSDRTQ